MNQEASTARFAGGCRCGAIRYEFDRPVQSAVCHCEDCRRSSGAPMVGWASVDAGAFRITAGEPRMWSSNGQALRYFCATCGTGIYYMNDAVMPGLIDVQITTLDDATAVAPEIQVQVAERLAWAEHIDRLPAFERFP
jgi:hypothetical protein